MRSLRDQHNQNFDDRGRGGGGGGDRFDVARDLDEIRQMIQRLLDRQDDDEVVTPENRERMAKSLRKLKRTAQRLDELDKQTP